ncbi:MAG: hypothetical protein IKP00_07835 [Victivallales bacterium]|nr:hypothetical protein [Victivallales bacterium]
MFNIIGSLFSLKRSIGLGVAIAAFLVAVMPRLAPQKAGQQNIQAQSGVVGMGTAPVQETVTPAQETTAAGEAVVTEGEQSAFTAESGTNKIFKELEFSEEGFNWQKDWWKYLALAIGSLLVLYFGIRITKMILRLIVFLLCVGAGFLGAICLEPLLSPWLSPRMPEGLTRFMTSQHAGYALGFLICYLVATLVISFIPRKMQGGPSSEKV